MGTNYYLERGVCPECDRARDSLHIGKSSAGWCFSLHIHPEKGIQDLPDWIREWSEEGTRIMNEYGDKKTPEEMLAVITERRREKWEDVPWGYNSWQEFHARNDSEKGPNNMLRHRTGRFCKGHGQGTWDLIEGDFS